MQGFLCLAHSAGFEPATARFVDLRILYINQLFSIFYSSHIGARAVLQALNCGLIRCHEWRLREHLVAHSATEINTVAVAEYTQILYAPKCRPKISHHTSFSFYSG